MNKPKLSNSIVIKSYIIKDIYKKALSGGKLEMRGDRILFMYNAGIFEFAIIEDNKIKSNYNYGGRFREDLHKWKIK